ncbi:MAG: ribosome-associated translation inhibitor RaiA [Candidatus Paceibacterota bacterium]|jgi:putative sigma-54 modulation protein
MNIKIKATNIELTDYLLKLVDQKIKKIEKLLPSIPDLIVEVEIGKTTQHHQKGDLFRAEVQVEVPGGKMLRAVSKKEDFRSALTDAREELEVQIKKHKEKMSLEQRRKAKK